MVKTGGNSVLPIQSSVLDSSLNSFVGSEAQNDEVLSSFALFDNLYTFSSNIHDYLKSEPNLLNSPNSNTFVANAKTIELLKDVLSSPVNKCISKHIIKKRVIDCGIFTSDDCPLAIKSITDLQSCKGEACLQYFNNFAFCDSKSALKCFKSTDKLLNSLDKLSEAMITVQPPTGPDVYFYSWSIARAQMAFDMLMNSNKILRMEDITIVLSLMHRSLFDFSTAIPLHKNDWEECNRTEWEKYVMQLFFPMVDDINRFLKSSKFEEYFNAAHLTILEELSSPTASDSEILQKMKPLSRLPVYLSNIHSVLFKTIESLYTFTSSSHYFSLEIFSKFLSTQNYIRSVFKSVMAPFDALKTSESLPEVHKLVTSLSILHVDIAKYNMANELLPMSITDAFIDFKRFTDNMEIVGTSCLLLGGESCDKSFDFLVNPIFFEEAKHQYVDKVKDSFYTKYHSIVYENQRELSATSVSTANDQCLDSKLYSLESLTQQMGAEIKIENDKDLDKTKLEEGITVNSPSPVHNNSKKNKANIILTNIIDSKSFDNAQPLFTSPPSLQKEKHAEDEVEDDEMNSESDVMEDSSLQFEVVRDSVDEPHYYDNLVYSIVDDENIRIEQAADSEVDEQFDLENYAYLNEPVIHDSLSTTIKTSQSPAEQAPVIETENVHVKKSKIESASDVIPIEKSSSEEPKGSKEVIIDEESSFIEESMLNKLKREGGESFDDTISISAPSGVTHLKGDLGCYFNFAGDHFSDFLNSFRNLKNDIPELKAAIKDVGKYFFQKSLSTKSIFRKAPVPSANDENDAVDINVHHSIVNDKKALEDSILGGYESLITNDYARNPTLHMLHQASQSKLGLTSAGLFKILQYIEAEFQRSNLAVKKYTTSLTSSVITSDSNVKHPLSDKLDAFVKRKVEHFEYTVSRNAMRIYSMLRTGIESVLNWIEGRSLEGAVPSPEMDLLPFIFNNLNAEEKDNLELLKNVLKLVDLSLFMTANREIVSEGNKKLLGVEPFMSGFADEIVFGYNQDVRQVLSGRILRILNQRKTLVHEDKATLIKIFADLISLGRTREKYPFIPKKREIVMKQSQAVIDLVNTYFLSIPAQDQLAVTRHLSQFAFYKGAYFPPALASLLRSMFVHSHKSFSSENYNKLLNILQRTGDFKEKNGIIESVSSYFGNSDVILLESLQKVLSESLKDFILNEKDIFINKNQNVHEVPKSLDKMFELLRDGSIMGNDLRREFFYSRILQLSPEQLGLVNEKTAGYSEFENLKKGIASQTEILISRVNILSRLTRQLMSVDRNSSLFTDILYEISNILNSLPPVDIRPINTPSDKVMSDTQISNIVSTVTKKLSLPALVRLWFELPVIDESILGGRIVKNFKSVGHYLAKSMSENPLTVACTSLCSVRSSEALLHPVMSFELQKFDKMCKSSNIEALKKFDYMKLLRRLIDNNMLMFDGIVKASSCTKQFIGDYSVLNYLRRQEIFGNYLSSKSDENIVPSQYSNAMKMILDKLDAPVSGKDFEVFLDSINSVATLKELKHRKEFVNILQAMYKNVASQMTWAEEDELITFGYDKVYLQSSVLESLQAFKTKLQGVLISVGAEVTGQDTPSGQGQPGLEAHRTETAVVAVVDKAENKIESSADVSDRNNLLPQFVMSDFDDNTTPEEIEKAFDEIIKTFNSEMDSELFMKASAESSKEEFKALADGILPICDPSVAPIAIGGMFDIMQRLTELGLSRSFEYKEVMERLNLEWFRDTNQDFFRNVHHMRFSETNQEMEILTSDTRTEGVLSMFFGGISLAVQSSVMNCDSTKHSFGDEQFESFFGNVRNILSSSFTQMHLSEKQMMRSMSLMGGLIYDIFGKFSSTRHSDVVNKKASTALDHARFKFFEHAKNYKKSFEEFHQILKVQDVTVATTSGAKFFDASQKIAETLYLSYYTFLTPLRKISSPLPHMEKKNVFLARLKHSIIRTSKSIFDFVKAGLTKVPQNISSSVAALTTGRNLMEELNNKYFDNKYFTDLMKVVKIPIEELKIVKTRGEILNSVMNEVSTSKAPSSPQNVNRLFMKFINASQSVVSIYLNAFDESPSSFKSIWLEHMKTPYLDLPPILKKKIITLNGAVYASRISQKSASHADAFA